MLHRILLNSRHTMSARHPRNANRLRIYINIRYKFFSCFTPFFCFFTPLPAPPYSLSEGEFALRRLGLSPHVSRSNSPPGAGWIAGTSWRQDGEGWINKTIIIFQPAPRLRRTPPRAGNAPFFISKRTCIKKLKPLLTERLEVRNNLERKLYAYSIYSAYLQPMLENFNVHFDAFCRVSDSPSEKLFPTKIILSCFEK
jgi:hypothetical protein